MVKGVEHASLKSEEFYAKSSFFHVTNNEIP